MDTKQIFQKADELTSGDRHNDYGDKRKNFQQVADLWNAYLGTSITATEVGVMLGLLKLARTRVSPTKEDSWVDAVGYFGLAGDLATNVRQDEVVLDGFTTTPLDVLTEILEKGVAPQV